MSLVLALSEPLFLLWFSMIQEAGVQRESSIDLRGSPDFCSEAIVLSGMVNMAGPGTPACSFQRVRENDVVALAYSS